MGFVVRPMALGRYFNRVIEFLLSVSVHQFSILKLHSSVTDRTEFDLFLAVNIIRFQLSNAVWGNNHC